MAGLEAEAALPWLQLHATCCSGGRLRRLLQHFGSGYGRGFGAGFGRDGEALLVGPSAGGHRIVRIALATGELLDVAAVPTFDEAVVEADLCLLASPRSISAVDARTLQTRWRYSREGERYHLVARTGLGAGRKRHQPQARGRLSRLVAGREQELLRLLAAERGREIADEQCQALPSTARSCTVRCAGSSTTASKAPLEAASRSTP